MTSVETVGKRKKWKAWIIYSVPVLPKSRRTLENVKSGFLRSLADLASIEINVINEFDHQSGGPKCSYLLRNLSG